METAHFCGDSGELTFSSWDESDLVSERHIRVLCMNSMTSSVQLLCTGHCACCCTYRSVNLDGEVIVPPDMLGGVDTSHISH